MDRSLIACLTIATALTGSGCSKPAASSGVEFRTLSYNAAEGTVRTTVRLAESKDGPPVSGVPAESFRVELDGVRFHPKVVAGHNAYTLEFTAPPDATVPSFAVLAEANGRTYSGRYNEPPWAAQFAAIVIFGGAFGLGALLLAQRAFPWARRHALMGLVPGAPGTASQSAVPPGTPSTVDASAPSIRVRLRSQAEHWNAIDLLVSATSVLGSEDRNSQLPFVKIDRETLDPAHAIIEIKGKEAHVLNLAGGLVKVAGVPVPTNGRARLRHACGLRLGSVDLDVTFEDLGTEET